VTVPADIALVAELAAIRRALEEAADALLLDAEAGFRSLRAAPVDLPGVEAALSAVITGCGFADLLGQRLQLLGERLCGATETRPDAHLLNGPTATGLDQAAADRLFAGG
jgi:hypothetical protein